jgi:hypothetical protein
MPAKQVTKRDGVQPLCPSPAPIGRPSLRLNWSLRLKPLDLAAAEQIDGGDFKPQSADGLIVNAERIF